MTTFKQFHHSVYPTCRDVLFSENGELKKALMVSKTTAMMYFSRIGSARRFSRLLHTCRGRKDGTGVVSHN